ncbi:MAG: aminotransferase [Magnetococcales bacterium]|nr:aminotransferase [Magnetococcales bacterium]
MPNVSDKYAHTEGSPIVAINMKAKAMAKEGREIFNFSIGVPGFLPPKHVYEAAEKAVKEDNGAYLASAGSEEVRKAFLGLLKKQGFDYSLEETCATMGAKNALTSLCQVLCNAGDEVLFPAPFWSNYIQTVQMADAVPVPISCSSEENYKLTPEKLEAAITPKTRIFLFNNPSNPTGMVYTKEEIAGLAAVLKKHNVWIISDDLYDKIVFDGEEFHHLLTAEPELRDRMLIVQSVSKSYGMPGWRVGFVAGPQPIIKMLVSVATNTFMCIPWVSQMAATAAISGDQSFIDERCAEFKQKRDAVMDSLKSIEGLVCPFPKGAFYAFPDISHFIGKTYKGQTITDDVRLCELLLESHGVACVPGSAFGHEGALRISYACDMHTLEKGMVHFETFFNEIMG